MRSSYLNTRDLALALVGADRAPDDLRRYLNRRGGAEFDRLVDRDSPDCFTDGDFRAVRKLNVNALHSARSWLRGAGKETVSNLLRRIPADRDIWEIEPDEYDTVLGPESPAWQLWRLIYDLQAGAGHAGRGVTAGKLMHGKRPRLIPIFDRRVATALEIPRGHFWEAMWCVMRDPDVCNALRQVQEQVSEAAELSLLRVLDIIAWMSGEKKRDDWTHAAPSVRDVPSAQSYVERVWLGQTLEAAQTLMNANEYSQLAVVSGTGKLEGAVSWRSIAQARFANECPTLSDATFRCPIVSLDNELLARIDTIYKEEFMLVTDEGDKLCGIVTAADLVYQFRDLTGAFFQISDIEGRLRRSIDRSFTPEELRTATGLGSAADMTFGQYMHLLKDADRWKKVHWLHADQAVFIDCLDRARRVRNKVMHASGDLSPDEKRELEQLFNVMRALDPRP